MLLQSHLPQKGQFRITLSLLLPHTLGKKMRVETQFNSAACSLTQQGRNLAWQNTSTTAQPFHHTLLLTTQRCQASCFLPLQTSGRNIFGCVKMDIGKGHWTPTLQWINSAFRLSYRFPWKLQYRCHSDGAHPFPCHTLLCWLHSHCFHAVVIPAFSSLKWKQGSKASKLVFHVRKMHPSFPSPSKHSLQVCFTETKHQISPDCDIWSPEAFHRSWNLDTEVK